jgi:hypothetical protein
MKNLFGLADVNKIREQIAHLRPDSQPPWGRMNVGQMLAHCSGDSGANLAGKTAGFVGQEISHRKGRANAPQCDDREKRAGNGRTRLNSGAGTIAEID